MVMMMIIIIKKPEEQLSAGVLPLEDGAVSPCPRECLRLIFIIIIIKIMNAVQYTSMKMPPPDFYHHHGGLTGTSKLPLRISKSNQNETIVNVNLVKEDAKVIIGALKSSVIINCVEMRMEDFYKITFR